MSTVAAKLPRDADCAPVQVLLGTTNRANLTAGAASTNTTLPTGTSGMVIVRCTDYFWLNFGTSGVTASAATTSILVSPGEGAYAVPSGSTHFAGLRVGSTDVVVQLESVTTT